MELDVLKELDKLNNSIGIKIRENYTKNELDILDFYPELDLKPPYTGTGSKLINPIKPFQLFPFFETILVDVLPLPNENLFQSQYGLSVDELIELEKKKKIAIRLPYEYVKYHDLENDYLDPILSRRPPSAIARNLNYSYLVNSNYLEEFEEENLFKDRLYDFGNNMAMELGSVDPIAIAAFDMMSGSGTNFLNFEEDIYVKAVQNNCQKLGLLGYNDVNKFIKKILKTGNGRLDWAYLYSSGYTSFLTDPIFNSLEGTHLVDNNAKEVLHDLFVRAKSKPALSNIIDENTPFPYYDMGKLLTEEIITATPINLEQSIDFDYSGAIEGLMFLEDAVTKKDIENITARTHELKSEICEANQIVVGMQNIANHIPKKISRIGFTIGFLGLMGIPDPTLQALSAVSSTIIGALGEFDAMKPVLENVLKFKKESHVLYLYNNYEKYAIKEYGLSNRVLNEGYLSNNPYIDKYQYYDSLYRKIPILRVMIDIDTRLIIGDGPSIEYTGKIPNNKLVEEIQDKFNNDFPAEFWKIMHKHVLLYGVAYLIKKENSYCIVNPKSINPIYENGNISSYNYLDNVIRKENVVCIRDPEHESIVESYILLFDEYYPDLTQKGNRPKLLYDIFFETRDKALQLMKTDFETSKTLLLKCLKTPIQLKNVVYTEIILELLGELHKLHKDYTGALKYYEKALDAIKNKTYSDFLENREKELNNKIIDTKKLL